ncbi:exonuclease V [Mycena belliarum]|uniref:Exonuclease V n=1 Tax=Mycena belliarum TaxID=1033014 RepID=A0AAD6U063_9AGAR|nr:exonuclease V [Mycena belliae]
MSEDEYDAYNDFAELTEEDLARLDASYSSAPPIVDANSSFVSGTAQSQAAAGPSISIEIEATPMENQTPIHKYRWRGTLSVTDIVSLAWCEVQFDYGLQQKRSRRLADRPASFTLDSGKQIVVQQDVAARNDKTTKRGRFIHKELELELQHEEIKIGISSEEERWALRLLNFLSSLVSLITEGCVREVPVVGIVNGVAVVGIIDELRLRAPPSSAAELLPTTTDPTPPSEHTIRVIDTKTRRSSSLPSDEDTEPARLQVMLYHRLLADLLAASPPFEYPALWACLCLNPSAPFSEAFSHQTGRTLGSGLLPKCLDDIVLLVQTRVAELSLPVLDATLQIIYRAQNKYPSQRHKGKGRRRETYPPATREDEDVAKAIELSIADAFEVDLANALQASAAAGSGDVPVEEVHSENPECIPAGYSTPVFTWDPVLAANFRPAAVPEQGPLSAPSGVPDAAAADSGVLGTKEFAVDDTFLDTYLGSALQWWHGARKAQGVSARQTGRCFSCEYYNGCEWREQQAAEATLRYRSSREAS